MARQIDVRVLNLLNLRLVGTEDPVVGHELVVTTTTEAGNAKQQNDASKSRHDGFLKSSQFGSRQDQEESQPDTGFEGKGI